MPERDLGRGRTAPFFLVRSFKVGHYQRDSTYARLDERLVYIVRRWWKWLVLAFFCLLLTPFVVWAAATLENPVPGSVKSGIGLISGWICDAEKLEVSFDGGPRKFVPYGSERTDTAGVCGDTNNGFGLLINYNELGDGPHTITLYADGVVVTLVTFNVQTLGTNFLRGVIGQGTITLSNETAVHVQWEETTQGFTIVGYGTQVGDGSAGEVCTQAPVEAETECSQMQTRIDALQEDIEHMQDVLDDNAVGCAIIADATMPGGYTTNGFKKDRGPFYCIDKAVFNVGPCIENEITQIYAYTYGSITVLGWDGGSLASSGVHRDLTIKHQTSNRAGDMAIVLGPAENGAYFTDGGAWGPEDETVTFYRVTIWRNNRGQGYVVRYDPETETTTLYDVFSTPIYDDALAAYISVYIRKFLTRIEGILDTEQIPQPRPLRCSDRQ